MSEISGEFTDASILLRTADGSTVQVRVRGAITGTLRIDERTIKRAGSPILGIVHDIALTLTGEAEVEAEHSVGRVTG